MPQIINTNIASLNAQRNLNSSQRANDTALSRLSSGLRINSAKDDAAGLAISTRFDSQIRGAGVASRNAGDGVSLAQTAEGSLNSITTNLQRIRELALQSANDTNTTLDRDALNAEVQQLIAEIDNTSKNSAFNGRKLLDGTFTDAVFQVGANRGETIAFGIGEASINTLGNGDANGVSSYKLGGSAPTALVAGDLVINGVAVGASLSSADTSSTTLSAQSSIAKAAAINAVSDTSGVKATVDANVVRGQNLSAGDASITINGTSFNIVTSAALSDTANLEAVKAAINEQSGVTGVRAEVAADPDGGITLIADDGRNIDLVGSAGAGVGATGDYTGTFTLLSTSGGNIALTSNTGNITNAGLGVGTFSGANSGQVGGVISDATDLAEGDLVINGVAVGATNASFDAASTSLAARSGIAVAHAINLVSDKSGVSAETTATRVNSGTTTATAASFSINGVSFDIAAQSDVGSQVSALVDAVNAKTGQIGVRAEVLDGDSYTLIADDGRNITLGGIITGGGAGAFAAAGVTQSNVVLKSAGKIEIDSNTTTGPGNAGFAIGTYGGSQDGQLLKNVDISTVAGANSAITAIDNALQAVASQAADLGAIQSRFQSVIANLEVTSENLSTANSRIKDADFAAETAALSRSQVLQQAGISILAQANARPQQVLSLLQ